MKKIITRRTEINIEIHEITIIRMSGRQQNGFCKPCQTVVPVFTPEKTALFLQIDVTEICRLIEIDRLHLIGLQRGGALICGNSLQKANDLLTNR